MAPWWTPRRPPQTQNFVITTSNFRVIFTEWASKSFRERSAVYQVVNHTGLKIQGFLFWSIDKRANLSVEWTGYFILRTFCNYKTMIIIGKSFLGVHNSPGCSLVGRQVAKEASKTPSQLIMSWQWHVHYISSILMITTKNIVSNFGMVLDFSMVSCNTVNGLSCYCLFWVRLSFIHTSLIHFPFLLTGTPSNHGPVRKYIQFQKLAC